MKVKVRGIYATALTKLFMESGFAIAQPSWDIVRKFQLEPDFTLPAVLIEDREDRQGVIVSGDGEGALEVIGAMRRRLFDMVIRPLAGTDSAPLRFDVEFPSLSKSALDQLRGQVVPTVRDHHKLKTFAPEYVDLVEGKLLDSPGRSKGVEEMLRERLVLHYLKQGQEIRIDHVRPEGEVVALTGGLVLGFDPASARLRLRRQSKTFRAGSYDGLGIAREEGDYAITEGAEGGWVLQHTYHSREGEIKGQFCNINTPIEFYPGAIRYIDLHVDVVRWPDGRAEIVDRDKLEASVRGGYLSPALAQKALSLAQELQHQLGPGL